MKMAINVYLLFELIKPDTQQQYFLKKINSMEIYSSITKSSVSFDIKQKQQVFWVLFCFVLNVKA